MSGLFYIRPRTYSAFLHQVGDHDDDLSVLLPNHPPKVLKCGLERTLGGYISPGLVVTLKGGLKKTQLKVRKVQKLRSVSYKTYIHVVSVDVVRVLGILPRQSS